MPISPAILEQLNEAGFAIIRNFFSAEETDAALPHVCARIDALSPAATYPKEFVFDANAWLTSEEMRKFLLQPKIGRLAAEILGVPAVRLYHTATFAKLPGDGEVRWHQDQLYNPLDQPMLAIWHAFGGVTREMGALQYAVGSHKLGLFDLREHNNEFDLPSTSAHIYKEIARLGLEVATIELGPGDVIVHNGLALHRSGPNETNRTRQAVTWFVYPDGAKVARPRYPAHDRERRVYFPGLLPGAQAATMLNPVL